MSAIRESRVRALDQTERVVRPRRFAIRESRASTRYRRSPNSCRKNSMISYEEEIKRFKPSLDVDQIEDAIAKVDLTDMNDIMTSLIEEAIKHKKDESAK